MCHKILEVPGAILLAPPELIENNDEPFYAGMVQKYHICADCYLDLMNGFVVQLLEH